MFLPKLQNLRALVFRQLLDTENVRLPNPESVGNLDGPFGQAAQIYHSRVAAPALDPVAQAMADLAADWTAPKLALRAEAQLALNERHS